jgi:hypothetical protein
VAIDRRLGIYSRDRRPHGIPVMGWTAPRRHQARQDGCCRNPTEGAVQEKTSGKYAAVTRVGLDLAKNVFQVHAVDLRGEVVVAHKVRRGGLLEFFARLAPCLVAMEACSSAHHWVTVTGHKIPFFGPNLRARIAGKTLL